MKPSGYPLIPAEEALALVLDRTLPLGIEEVGLGEAAGRVCAADIRSEVELPRFPASAVDGFGFQAASAPGPLRVVGESAAGRPFTGRVQPGQAIRLLTGGMLPEGADTVAMVEDCVTSELPDGMVTVPEGFRAGLNFHRPGDDLRPGDLVARAGHPLGAAEVGLLASLGIDRISVWRRPRVALMSTGDELAEPGGRLEPGQIYDSNRFSLQAALIEAGAGVRFAGRAPDRAGPLRDFILTALEEADVLVTSGGVSVGTHDLVKPVLEALGQVLIGRVKLRPGKPFTFATLPGGRYAFGLPGFPVSSLVTFEVFVRPALRRMQGFARLQRPRLPVRLGYDARAAGDRTEYQRVSLRRSGGELVAIPTGSQSSSRLLSLAGADALVVIPPGQHGIPAGTLVEAIILDLP